MSCPRRLYCFPQSFKVVFRYWSFLPYLFTLLHFITISWRLQSMAAFVVHFSLKERTGELWNICLVPKLRRNRAFQKDGHRNFVRTIEYRAFQKWLYVVDAKRRRITNRQTNKEEKTLTFTDATVIARSSCGNVIGSL